jgi:hypothetical protein
VTVGSVTGRGRVAAEECAIAAVDVGEIRAYSETADSLPVTEAVPTGEWRGGGGPHTGGACSVRVADCGTTVASGPLLSLRLLTERVRPIASQALMTGLSVIADIDSL